MRTEVTVGQYLDVLTQATGDTSVERAGKVARYKSAKYTVERPLLFGAALAGAPAELHRRLLRRTGCRWARRSSCATTCSGSSATRRTTGKPAGDDLREGKRTYLVAAAFEAADAAGRAALERRARRPRPRRRRAWPRCATIITGTGALERTERRIAELTAAALDALNAARLAPEAAEVLTSLATAATTRTR